MTFADMKDAPPAAVLEAYGTGGEVRRHRSVYFIRRPDGEQVLKPIAVGALRALLIGEMLGGDGLCPVLPRLLRTNEGRPYLWFKGSRYLLTERIPGREADYRRTQDFQAAIRAMRSFHRYGEELIHENPARWMQLKTNLQEQWRIILNEMEICRRIAIRTLDAWSKQYLKLYHHFYEQAHRAVCELWTFGQEHPVTICYHDWAFHNLIIRGEEAGLVDFDYIIADHPVHDKANLIGKYLRLFQWESGSLLAALWNFDRNYGWRRGEIRLLRIFLTLPYDYWILGRQYFLERQPWSRSYFQRQWERKILPYRTREQTLELLSCLET